MKTIMERAKDELELAGLFTRGPKGIMDGQIGEAAMQVMETWAAIEVSGPAAGLLIRVLTKLMGEESLTPLTSDPAEWDYLG